MKRHNLKNRNEKIRFLKELIAGRTAVSKILPMVVEVWFIEDKGETFVRQKTGERFTKKEYDEHSKREGSTSIRIPPILNTIEDHSEKLVREKTGERFTKNYDF